MDIFSGDAWRGAFPNLCYNGTLVTARARVKTPMPFRARACIPSLNRQPRKARKTVFLLSEGGLLGGRQKQRERQLPNKQ